MPVGEPKENRLSLSVLLKASCIALGAGVGGSCVAAARQPSTAGRDDLFETSKKLISSRFATMRHTGIKDVCIVDLRTPNISAYAKTSMRNHRHYAERHGYSYLGFEGRISGQRFTDRTIANCRSKCGGIGFQKFSALATAAEMRRPDDMPLCRWMMWLDTDAVFTCFSSSVEDIIRGSAGASEVEKSVILSREETTFATSFLNSGVFLVKNSPEGRDFLEGCARLFDKHQVRAGGDQNAIQEYAFGRDTRDVEMSERGEVERATRPEIALTAQRVMNSFVWWGDPLSVGSTDASEWQAGDYIAHIASRDPEGRLAHIVNVTAKADQC